jgi:hypothetical protein
MEIEKLEKEFYGKFVCSDIAQPEFAVSPDRVWEWIEEIVSQIDCRVSPKTAELDLETMIDNLPENRVLYKDSGLWMIINEEDFNTTDKMLFQVARYQQTTKETFAQFIKRCFDSENNYYITE